MKSLKRFFFRNLNKIIYLVIFKYNNKLLKSIRNFLTIRKVFHINQSYINSFSDYPHNNLEFIYTNPVFLNDESVNSSDGIQTLPSNPVHGNLVLKEVCIVGGSDIMLFDFDNMYYPFKEFDTQNKFRHTGNGILYSDNQTAVIRKYKIDKQVIEEGIKLTKHFSFNYFHFMMEIAPIFHELEKENIPAYIPLLIDEVCLNTPQFKEVLIILNHQKRAFISIQANTTYKINTLWVPESSNILPPNLKDFAKIEGKDVLYKTEALEYVRNNMMPHKSEKTFPKKIFISRKFASKRRKYNEEEVRNVLEEQGFTTIFIEEFSISEQISLFNGADFIIGATGAALTNLIYCKEGCEVLIFTNVKEPVSFFSTLGTWSGADVKYMFDKKSRYTTSSSIHSPFQVDITFLKQYLSKNN